jgi:acetyl-CoA C-acetyltransferase
MSTSKQAVIVSMARTPIGKAYRGSLNATYGATLGACAVTEAVSRAGIEPEAVDDVIMGGSLNEGTTGANITRQIVLRSGLPVQTAGVTVNRYCSTGLQTIAMAAHRVVLDDAQAVVAGGLESISLVQNQHANGYMARDPWLDEHRPDIFMTMLQTAENRRAPLQPLTRGSGRPIAGKPGTNRRRAASRAIRRGTGPDFNRATSTR